MGHLHLKTEVSFGYQSGCASVNIANYLHIKFNTEPTSGMLNLIIEYLHTFENRLVIIDIVDRFNESLKIKFLFKFKMSNLSLMLQLDINIDIVSQNVI